MAVGSFALLVSNSCGLSHSALGVQSPGEVVILCFGLTNSAVVFTGNFSHINSSEVVSFFSS